jgi:hypothetical protein
VYGHQGGCRHLAKKADMLGWCFGDYTETIGVVLAEVQTFATFSDQ